MKTTYETEFERDCPANGARDKYTVRFESYRLIKVEDILDAIERLPAKEFQENLTQSLADTLRCNVMTTGYHSGVKTTCECS